MKFLALAASVLATTSNFYISADTYSAFSEIDVTTTKSITFRWEWDSCALQTDGGGDRVPAVNLGGQCQFNGQKTFPPKDKTAVFPNGLQTLFMSYGFATGQKVDLLPSVPKNDGNFVAITHSITIDNLSNFQSGYYSLSMSAIDADGNLVKGSSPMLIFKNTQPLPDIQQITLYSPLQGSYWLPNKQYRIRLEVLPTGFQPTNFHVDVYNAQGNLITRVLTAATPFANDTLLGPDHPLNYTLWTIDPSFANQKVKIKLTGVQVIGNNVVELPSAPTTFSGYFLIGPVLSN
ncbi:hypothetical protein HK103_001316 [Boothiomyces macroporosus]|uniref:Uncharacterized protein n=1 Tax=Boothiomyces macroporosus TaxID=261099 RepID=A0AAD5Y0N8_9FUNG|nr:hypothetical protein HK103_001316 [Boothiomyces macroporosus]